MGIDSIRGRPPVSPPVADDGSGTRRAGTGPLGATEAQPSRSVSSVSSVSSASPFSAAAAPRPAGVEPVAASILAQFRSGQIDVARYLDLKVEEATAHLRALPPAQLASIRSTLRDRLVNDPALAGLVEAATGRLVPPDDG
jgi:hypothetical protein